MTVQPCFRVLITRAAHQSSELANHLRSLDVEPILIPLIELTDPASYSALDAALGILQEFHWLIFTSANAVEAFHRRLVQLKPDWTDASALAAKIAAIGLATARALEAFGLKPSLIPATAVAESFVEALLPYARQEDGAPTRFLLVRAEAARDILPDALKAAGAEVTIAPAYRTIIPAESVSALRGLFAQREHWPDAITFTSSSTATNLFALLESAQITLPAGILRASIGAITSKTLRDAGYPPHLEAPEATTVALAEALLRYLQANEL